MSTLLTCTVVAEIDVELARCALESDQRLESIMREREREAEDRTLEKEEWSRLLDKERMERARQGDGILRLELERSELMEELRTTKQHASDKQERLGAELLQQQQQQKETTHKLALYLSKRRSHLWLVSATQEWRAQMLSERFVRVHRRRLALKCMWAHAASLFQRWTSFYHGRKGRAAAGGKVALKVYRRAYLRLLGSWQHSVIEGRWLSRAACTVAHRRRRHELHKTVMRWVNCTLGVSRQRRLLTVAALSFHLIIRLFLYRATFGAMFLYMRYRKERRRREKAWTCVNVLSRIRWSILQHGLQRPTEGPAGRCLRASTGEGYALETLPRGEVKMMLLFWRRATLHVKSRQLLLGRYAAKWVSKRQVI